MSGCYLDIEIDVAARLSYCLDIKKHHVETCSTSVRSENVMLNRPLALLVGTGAALGGIFPLGKLAAEAAINPALWAATIAFGAGLVMLAVAHRYEPRPTRGAAQVRFAFVSGFVSYVVPNSLTFAAIPKIGSGMAAIMFALSPGVTAALSVALRVRPPSVLGVVGIGVGLGGALVIIVVRDAGFGADGTSWLLLALLIPVFLGVGNIYRTTGWPEGAGPMRLAALTNLAAVPPLLVVTVVMSGTIDIGSLAGEPGLVGTQLAISTFMFVMFFKLQEVGGPTYLSQIGYVAAAVGVGIGVIGLGERYPAPVWSGVAIVAMGVALSTLAQVRSARSVADSACRVVR
jgi:drug/metabolite transporter (DMT)-like permease